MAQPKADSGRDELRGALGKLRGLLTSVGLFSLFVNLLMLTGPLFMLQVYERVLSSRSLPTLLALFLLTAGLFLVMGILDHIRARVLARAGARFQTTLDTRVYRAVLDRARTPQARSAPATGLRDLESIQRMLSSPAPFSFFDAPWAPIFLGVIFLFHPLLGWLATFGAVLLLVLTLLNELRSRSPQNEALQAQAAAETFEQSARRDAEALHALGMVGSTAARWRTLRDKSLSAHMAASDRTGAFSATSKTLRFFLQSAMLGLGAWLVIEEQTTPGVMIAASIMLGRALAPIEQAIGQWSSLQRARQGWRSLSDLLTQAPAPAQRTPLPKPSGPLTLQNVAISRPGEREPIVRGLTFDAAPGEAIGIIGPSGSGKSTLARALIGVWQPLVGELRLDGATYDQWDPDVLGRHIGYLPQDVAMLDGTVTENIARFDPQPNVEEALRASKAAGAHDMVLRLPDGYDTRMGVGGAQVSGGQRQRIALARALYGQPALIVLDEPNSNLDANGDQALAQAIQTLKSEGRIVLVIAHRPSIVGVCDKLLMLEGGRQRAFGPRDEILQQTTKNAAAILKAHVDGKPEGAPRDAAAASPERKTRENAQ